MYGPNTEEPIFYTNLFLTLSTLTGQYIIVGGFNCTLAASMDRSMGIDINHIKNSD